MILKVTLNLSPYVIANSNEETNFPHKLLLIDRKALKLFKAFKNNSSAKMKLSKTQFSKIVQSRGSLGRRLEPLLKHGLPLIKNGLKRLAESTLIPFGLTSAASATEAAIQNKILGSGMVALIMSNEKMDDMMKRVKSIKESGLLIKGASETIENAAKNKKLGFSTCY